MKDDFNYGCLYVMVGIGLGMYAFAHSRFLVRAILVGAFWPAWLIYRFAMWVAP